MSLGNPKICIVIPILNEAAYLKESLDSLMAQKYQPIELVCYDGGSTDGSLDILAQYPIRTHVIKGLGQMASINAGWKATDAEFVTWWAGDDRYLPGALSCLVAELKKHPSASFVHADADVIDEHGTIIGRSTPGHVTLVDLVGGFPVVPQTTLIRRSALAKAGMMNESLRLAADWDLYLRLLQYYPSHYLPLTVAQRRIHAGSEDSVNVGRSGEACSVVLNSFFSRPDLTVDQLQLKRRALACAQLSQAWASVVSNSRDDAWDNLWAAIKLHPPSPISTRVGRHLLARLLWPFKVGPRQINLLRRTVFTRFPGI